MLECSKRQKVVKRSEGLTILRCINKQCSVHGSEVNEETCALCPVRSVLNKTPPCRGVKAMPLEELPSVDRAAAIDVSHLSAEVRNLQEGTVLEGAEVPDTVEAEYPALSLQLWQYKEALVKWNKAGRPTRTDEEVQEIHDKLCTPCGWYDPAKKRCRGCGCKVTTGAVAVFNKLRMATESCPKGLW